MENVQALQTGCYVVCCICGGKIMRSYGYNITAVKNRRKYGRNTG
ncbi:MAG: hypothetical protein HPY66_3453 [Firmicutes bacterium]|nr:hypothetical protein [Bacillota bacterium]